MWFPELLRDAGGDHKPSAMRAALLFWAVGVFAAWVAASYNAARLVEIPQTVVTVLGLLAGGKAVQRFGETK